MLLLPYQGKKEDYVIKSMKKIMNTLLSTGIATKIAYVGNKFSTSFREKDVINLIIIMTYATKVDVQKLVIMIIT